MIALAPPVFVTGINSDPQDGGVPIHVVPTLSSSGNVSISTSSSYEAFPAHSCSQITIGNNTGVVINTQQDGSGDPFPVFPGTYYTFYGLSDASQISVSRADGVATAVTVNARWEG